MKNILKPLLLPLLMLLLWSFPQEMQASHLAGGELTYRYISPAPGGAHLYEVNFTWIRDCSDDANPLATTEQLRISGCGGNISTVMNRILVETITPVCDPSLGCGQANPTVHVYERHVYQTQVALAPCDSWTLSVRNNARNNLIITTGVSGNFYIDATLNNLLEPTNSSPVFGSLPNLILCVNQPFNVNQLVTEIDGHTLEYSLISPMNHSGGLPMSVLYNPGYSFMSPYDATGGGGVPLTLDPATGALTGTPTSIEVTVMALRVTERDGMGNIVGTVMRDIQIQIVNCFNLPPTVSSISYDDTICAGEPFSHIFNSSDPDAR